MSHPRFALVAAAAVGLHAVGSTGCAPVSASTGGRPGRRNPGSVVIRGVEVDIGAARHRGDYADIRLTMADGRVIYVDPCTIAGGHDAEVVLITHLHDDHFCPAKIAEASNDDTVLVMPASGADEARGLAQESRILLVIPGQEHMVKGVRVETVPAYTPTNSIHPRSLGWVGYVITVEGSRFYASGDTALVPELESLKADVAFLNIGGDVARDVFGGSLVGMLTGKTGARLCNTIRPEFAVPLHAFQAVDRRDLDAFLEGVDTDIKIVMLPASDR